MTEVLISGKLHDAAIAKFKNHEGISLIYKPDCPRDTLLELVSSAQVLVSRSETNIDKALIDAAPNLKIIARAAVGVGNIDVPYATEKGILVLNCPGKNTNAAAELTMALLLSMLRKVPLAYAKIKEMGWDRHKFSGFELFGKSIGIVGLGNVGHRVAKFAHGFDMEVYAYDPYISPHVFEKHKAIQCRTLREIAGKVDVLSFHVPLTQETRNFVDKELFSAMKKGAWLINASRGEILVEDDLVAALDGGQLSGAAIDTWQNEPNLKKEMVSHPLVWGTPHIGASTEEAQSAIGRTVYEQVVKAIEGSVVDYPINLPQVGVLDKPFNKAYTVLAEKLGTVMSQILDFNPEVLEITLMGELAAVKDAGMMRLAALKGMLSHRVDSYVSFVNAQSFADRMEIKVVEKMEGALQGYSSALKLTVMGEADKRLEIGGTVFEDDKLRLSWINDFNFELEPDGQFILLENLDRVGVIGKVGTFLGERGMNIDSFYLSRNKKGGKAMSLIRVDGVIDEKDIKSLTHLENIIYTKKFSI